MRERDEGGRQEAAVAQQNQLMTVSAMCDTHHSRCLVEQIEQIIKRISNHDHRVVINRICKAMFEWNCMMSWTHINSVTKRTKSDE